MSINLGKRRSAVVVGTAAALVLSLIGGSVELMFADHDTAPATTALKPLEPAADSPLPNSEPSPEEEPDLSMFGLGGDNATAMLGVGGGNISATPQSTPYDGQTAMLPGITPAAAGGGSVPAGSAALPGLPGLEAPAGGLPAVQLPAAPDVDLNALLAPLVAAQNNANAANIANSVVGTSVGVAGAALNSAGIIIGDLILYSALSNNGQNALNQLQGSLTALAAAPEAVAAVDSLAAAGVQLPPAPDLTGLAEVFAASAAAPSPFALPSLPGLPELPAAPQLPSPEEVLGGLALGAAALPALPALPAMPGLPELPGAPQLPKPEEIVGGLAAVVIAGAVLGTIGGIFFQPPSLTRMMGFPF